MRERGAASPGTGVPGLRNGTPAPGPGAMPRTVRGAGSEAACYLECTSHSFWLIR